MRSVAFASSLCNDDGVGAGSRTVHVSALRGAPLLRMDDEGAGETVEGSGLGLTIVQAAALQQGPAHRLN